MLRLLAAEWVLPVVSDPIPDGVVAIEDGKIAWVGPRRDLPSRFLRAPLRAFPRSLLLPGWVNAHTHLDLTAALGLLPGRLDRCADWLRAVDRFRAALPEHVVQQSVRAGLDLLATTGTTTVASVGQDPGIETFLDHPLRSVIFREVRGFRRDEEAVRETIEWLDGAEALIQDAENPRVSLGLAPHAPFSVSYALQMAFQYLQRQRGLPLSMHVAESPAEGQLFRQAAGPLRQYQEELGISDADWKAPYVSPVRYLEETGVLAARPAGGLAVGKLAVHCRAIEPEDIPLLKQSGATVIWCPGSDLHFGAGPHPAPALVAAGIPVALGTESAAANAGLSMLREVRLAAQAAPEVDPAVWLRAATLTGAAALGLGAVTGSLEPGKAADLQVLEGVPAETRDPQEALLEAALRVRVVLVEGSELRIR